MSLKPFNKISMPDLINYDAASLRSDIINKIQNDQEWNALWDGELYQNAFQMTLELFSYLFERNAKAANIQIKEKFLNQAFSEQSIYDNLADLRIQLQQSKSSSVVVRGTPQDAIISESIIIPRFTKIQGKNANGVLIDFEFIKRDEMSGKYNYFDNIIITPDINNTDHFDIELYAGTTNVTQYTINQSMLENFILEIDAIDIISGSIQVYYTTLAAYPIELPYTESFVVPPAPMPLYFPNGKPHYTIRYNQDGSASILFGTTNFGGAFEEQHIGNEINVFYRTGGGDKTNILVGGINDALSFPISQSNNITINFVNTQNAAGGADKENVFQAQVFAPYRYGRGKAIVDTQDAKNKLYQLLVKHEIESPVYDEINRNVPLLHAYHKVVYKRDFTNFIVPEYTSGESLSDYNQKFLDALNDFCNISGIKDKEVTDEEVSTFAYPNNEGKTSLEHFLNNKYPLAGSLKAYAKDYRDLIIDSRMWESNYVVDYRSGETSRSRLPNTHTELATDYFANITVLNTSSGRNDLLVFQIDYDIRPYTFTIQMTEGIKTYQTYAEELQALIISTISINVPELFSDAVDWQFVAYEELADTTFGRVILRSPSTGYNSSIRILDNGSIAEEDTQYNLYKFFGWDTKIYRPAEESGVAFADENLFYYYSNKMVFNFREDRYTQSKTIDYNDLNVVVNHSSSNGHLLEIVLTGENEDLLEQLFEGDYPLSITAFNALDKPVDYIVFPSITSIAANPGTNGSGNEFLPDVYTPNSIFKSTIENDYEYNVSKVVLRLIDNAQVDYYSQSYPTVERIDMVRIYEDPINPGVYLEDPAFPNFEFLEENGNYTQIPTQETGTVCLIQLTPTQQALLTIGDNYMLKLFHRDGSNNLVLIESARIYSLVDGINAFSDLPSPEVAIDQGYAENEYNHTNAQITFKFLNGTLNPAIVYYEKQFADFSYLQIDYQRKTYENITVSYMPNMYYPEGEARGILNILSAKENRLIGLEHLFKSVIFKPFPCKALLTIRKNYSIADAVNEVKNYLEQLYYYSNENAEHSIGSTVGYQVIKNSINKIADTYGVVAVDFSSAEQTYDEDLENTYYFILDYSVYEQLKSLELRYADLTGLTDLYAFEIMAISEGVQ